MRTTDVDLCNPKGAAGECEAKRQAERQQDREQAKQPPEEAAPPVAPAARGNRRLCACGRRRTALMRPLLARIPVCAKVRGAILT